MSSSPHRCWRLTKNQHIHPSGIQIAQLPALTHSSLLLILLLQPWLCLEKLWLFLKCLVNHKETGQPWNIRGPSLFFLIWPPKTPSVQLGGTSQLWEQQHYKDRNSPGWEIWVWTHWKGQEWPGTSQGATITHPEIGFHFHTGNFPQPSNLIKYPFPKWKICKCPKLHISFHPQRVWRWRGEVRKGHRDSSKLREKQELEITLEIISLLICTDRNFSSTNSSRRFQNKRKKLWFWIQNFLYSSRKYISTPSHSSDKTAGMAGMVRVEPPLRCFPLPFPPF